MPRYFIDYLNHPDLCDRDGIVLENDAAAKQEVLALAHDAMDQHSLRNFQTTDAIALRNEAGEQIFKTLIRHR